MSSDKTTNPSLPSSSVSPSFSWQIWTSLTTLVLGDQAKVERNIQKTSMDMQDITYLMDMDGEGLCFHQMNKNDEAFKKQ